MTRTSSSHLGLTAVLDIGTSKTVCLVAAPMAGGAGSAADGAWHEAPLRILGIGHQQSRGVKAGVIIDLAEAEHCIRATLAQAERMAGVTLESVVVSISCGRLKSHTITASAGIGGATVTARDVSRLMAGARAYIERDGRRLVHANRKAVYLDGNLSGGDPAGMAGRHITSSIHAIAADEAPIRNLLMVLERCHVRTAGVVVAPFASALAVTSEEERQLGVTVIDMGSGTTKLAAFSGGHLEFAASVPIGSGLLTTDIARALHTPHIEAERIKALYGNLFSARSDEHEDFAYPQSGGEDGQMQQATRAQLASVIRPRARGILEAVALATGAGRLGGGADGPVVLTGGGSLLTGVAEFASDVLQRPVRKGQAAEISGLPPVARSPAFATATGLLMASGSAQERQSVIGDSSESEHDGYLQRVGAWLKSGF